MMNEYRLAELRSAELVRDAGQARRARHARRGAQAGRAQAGGPGGRPRGVWSVVVHGGVTGSRAMSVIGRAS